MTRASSKKHNHSLKKVNVDYEPYLVYPHNKPGFHGKITITQADLDALEPGEFLNDNIIDFYLRYLWENLEPVKQQRIHIFNCFFYHKLLSSNSKEEAFRSIQKWTRKIDVFNKDFLIIPVNERFEVVCLELILSEHIGSC
jgi:sentrin-specific protease 7